MREASSKSSVTLASMVASFGVDRPGSKVKLPVWAFTSDDRRVESPFWDLVSAWIGRPSCSHSSLPAPSSQSIRTALRVAAHLEDLEHCEGRDLGQLAAEDLAGHRALGEDRLLVREAGAGRLGVAGDLAEGDGAAGDLDAIARLEQALPARTAVDEAAVGAAEVAQQIALVRGR